MKRGNSGFGAVARVLLLHNYLLENAIKEHPAQRKDILEYLENEGYPITVNTFYRDLALIQDVCHLQLEYNEHKKGYYVLNPLFEPHELRLMIDSIQASRFITKTKASEITRKIRKIAGKHLQASLNRTSYVADRIRSKNDSVVKDADNLHKAIAADAKTAFYYFHYSPDRRNPKSYSKSGKKLIVSPFALYWNNGNYYLYAYDGTKFRFYRVDRMEKISEPLLEKREGHDLFKEKDLTQKKAKVFDMYATGKSCDVKFRCHNRIAHSVIDQFGKDIMMMTDDDKHFTFTQSVELSPPFFAWVATFGHSIKILSPDDAVKGMRDFLKDSMDMYKNDGNT